MLTSRTADALYWIGRYVERAQHTARVIDVRLALHLDRRDPSGRWDFTRLYAGLRMVAPPAGPADPPTLVESMVFDPANSESVTACLAMARANARQVRTELSVEMCEELTALVLRVKQAQADGTWRVRPHDLLELVVDGAQLFHDVADATLEQGEPWRYVQVGRLLERASGTAALLALYLRDNPRGGEHGNLRDEPGEGIALLRSCAAISATDAFDAGSSAGLRRERLVEFILLDTTFPYSIRSAAARLQASLRGIALGAGGDVGARAERIAGRLHATLESSRVEDMLADDPEDYVAGISRYCSQIHAALCDSHLATVSVRRPRTS